MNLCIELKPGQVFYFPVSNPDYSNTIRLRSGIPQVFLGGNKSGQLKVKKWGNGRMGDKNAKWRHSPMSHIYSMLHKSWVAKGGKKKDG